MTRNRRGFSLLELLIALTILAIALVPVAYFYTKSLQTVEAASIRTRAINLAQERLAEVRQMPYDEIRTNVTPSSEQVRAYNLNTSAVDWYGYDFESSGRNASGRQESAGMFAYPLPLYFNPYQPQTQGYDNAIGFNHYVPNNPTGDAHVNINDSIGSFSAFPAVNYEYEPIGFYTQKVFNRNSYLLDPADRDDIGMADRRTLTVVEPSVAPNALDHFRSGYEQQIDKYSVYGRRTIILDVIPEPVDTDGDNFAADDDRDGGGTALNPYPLAKGPNNKFQMVSKFGTRGKLVVVQVFWLPRQAVEGYIDADELNKVELKTFIASSNEATNLQTNAGQLTRNDFLFISPPN